MRRRRSSILALIIIILLPLGVGAAESVTDWGGFLDSQTGITYDGSTGFTQKLKSGLWIDSQFSERYSLRAQGSYLLTLDRPVYGMLDRFVFTGEFLHAAGEDGTGYRLLLEAGRFGFSEFSGYVLEHRLDGFRLRWDRPGFSLTAGAGYSGLAFVPENRILLTGSDLGVQAAVPGHGYALAPPKVIEQLEVSFPQLFLGQDLTLSLLAQQDLQPEGNLLSPGDRIHTEYLGVGLSGSNTRDLFHSLYAYLNYGHGAYTTLAALAVGELSYYMEDLNFSRLKLRLLYSTGDAAQDGYYGGYSGGGLSGHFIPLSHGEQFGIVFSPSPGNIAVGELAYSLKPLSTQGGGGQELQLELRAMSFLRSTTGAISEGSVNATSDQLYLGSEADLRIKYRPFSDLGLSLTGGFFFPNNYTAESAIAPGSSAVQIAGRFELSLSY